MKMIVAGIDAGGTSWKLLAAEGPDRIIARASIPTTTPEKTIDTVSGWIEKLRQDGCQIEAIGIACFGPIDRNPKSQTFGQIGESPKTHWRGSNPKTLLESATGLPCALDTDVNGALLAEAAWGAGKGLSDLAYVTVGGGVGGAATVAGYLVGAPDHAEFGHIKPDRTNTDRKAFAGICPFHQDCIEGLVSSPAIEARWGMPAHLLPDDHEAWPIIAGFIAQLCLSITYLISPQRIILGGGVMQRPHLIVEIRKQFSALTNGYIIRAEAGDIDNYIVPPFLGADAGAFGGVLLALKSMQKDQDQKA